MLNDMIQNYNPQDTPATPNTGLRAGIYKHTGGQYYESTCGHLVKVLERKQPTALRPKLYLMQRTAAGKLEYLTSLYPNPGPDVFTAEVQRRYYTVQWTDAGLIVTPKEAGK